jgi:hypothetical protein
MEPSAIHYEPVVASASPEVPMNQLADNIEWALVYALRHEEIDGLDIGTWGGRWGGFSIDEEEYTLTDDSDNYLVVARATGVLSIATATTNWNATTTYARVYKITTADGAITAIEDHRAGAAGVHGPSVSATPTAGKHMIFVSAAAMRPRVSNGCAALATIENTSDRPNISGLNFDPSSDEFAQFYIEMPKSWNAGTVTFEAVWRHGSTTTDFGVAWTLKGVAVSNDDTIDAAFGTAQVSVDTGGTTDDRYVSPESDPITLAGTPAKSDGAFFEVSRDTDDSGDSLAIDATLLGIRLYITTDADTDA